MQDYNQLIEEIKGWMYSGLLPQMFRFLIWAGLILLFSRLLNKRLGKSISDNAIRYRSKKSIRLISYILILVIAVISFTGKLQYFNIAIGLISAGIAFSMQEVLLSFAGWIAIFGTKTYKPGDRIEISGVKGDVIDIGLSKTTLMEIGVWTNSDNYSGRIVQVSNGAIFKGPIHNYSTDFPFVWDEIVLPIKYGADLKMTEEMILGIAKISLTDYATYAHEHWKVMVNKYLIENAIVEPTLSLKLTDNWLEFTLRFVVDYKKRRVTKNNLYIKILAGIEQSAGKIQLASETIEINGLSDYLEKTGPES